jgi:hypothetical protein
MDCMSCADAIMSACSTGLINCTIGTLVSREVQVERHRSPQVALADRRRDDTGLPRDVNFPRACAS